MTTRATLWALSLALAGLPGHAWSQAASAASAVSTGPGSTVTPGSTPTTAGALATVPAGPFALTRKDGKGWSVRVPIGVAEGKAPAELTLVDAVFKEGRSVALIETFKPRYVAAAEGRGSALELDTGDKDVLPGSYVLSLMLSETADKKSSQPVALTVTVGTPQVKVETTKVVVAQVREFLGGTTGGDGTLKVSWGNGPAPIGLTPREVHDPPAKGESDTAGLEFTLQTAPAGPPAPTMDFKVGAVGSFPLGTTIGRIDLHSPSLATPVSVPYVAYVRRSYWWIAVLAGMGALAGLVLRTQIPKQRGLLLAGAATAAARRSVLQALQGVADADFKDKMTAISRELDRADVNLDAAVRTAAAKAAEEAVRTALAGIEAQVPPLRARIETLHDLTNASPQLPKSLLNRMLALLPEVEHAAQLLNDRAIDKCTRLVNNLGTVGLSGLREDADAYLAALSALLSRAGPQPFPMGANLADHLAQIKADAAAHALPSSDTPTAVAKVRDIFQKVQRFSDSARIKADSWCHQAEARLVEAFGAVPAAVADVRALCAETADRFALELQAPIGSDWPDPADSPLVPAWTQALMALAPGANSVTLESQLKQGHWYEAVAMTVAAAPPSLASAPAAASAGALVAMAAPFDEAMLSISGSASTASRGALAALTRPPTIAELVGLRHALLKKERNLAFIQSVGFAIVFVAGVHFLYANDWIGTAKEMAALFILAFGVDLTSDSVIAALRKS